MKQPLSRLILPNIIGVKSKLFKDPEDSRDDLLLLELHKVAIASLDEELNRTFNADEAAFLIAEDLSFALAAFKYENPVDLLIPSHIQDEINKLKFVPGF